MFVFNNKELIPSLSVEENKFESFSKIYVVRTNTVYGSGYSMMFTDVSKNKTKEITFSKDAPSYRTISKGINLFGICLYKKCKAYKKKL